MATFNVANSPTPVPFEIQFVIINSSDKEMSHLRTCLCKIPVPFTLIETRDYTAQSNVPSIETNLFHTCQESVTKVKCNRKRNIHCNIKAKAKDDTVDGKRMKLQTFDDKISAFKAKIKEGPYYICVICNRCLYRKTVQHYKSSNYDTPQNVLSIV